MLSGRRFLMLAIVRGNIMPKIELDQKTYESIKALADRAELTEAETITAMYHWLHNFYKGINGSIGLDLKAIITRLKISKKMS